MKYSYALLEGGSDPVWERVFEAGDDIAGIAEGLHLLETQTALKPSGESWITVARVSAQGAQPLGHWRLTDGGPEWTPQAH